MTTRKPKKQVSNLIGRARNDLYNVLGTAAQAHLTSRDYFSMRGRFDTIYSILERYLWIIQAELENDEEA